MISKKRLRSSKSPLKRNEDNNLVNSKDSNDQNTLTTSEDHTKECSICYDIPKEQGVLQCVCFYFLYIFLFILYNIIESYFLL